VQALARNFLCVADEVWLLDHQDTPGAKFFRDYTKHVPAELGFAPTTKQGVYAMTPDGEYLGGHFGRHSRADTLAMLKESLLKWNELAQKKALKPKPIPGRAPNRTWGVDGLPSSAGGQAGAKAGLILQVYTRDLPGASEKTPGIGEYKDFWNENWIDFSPDELLGFVPKGGAKGAVPDALIRRMGRECLIDNVRGQVASWAEGEIKKASLQTEVVSAKEGLLTLRFQGEFTAEAGPRGYDCTLHGKAVFDSRARQFRLFELVAAGIRKGPTNNFRLPGEPASPQGVAFIIEGQYDTKEKGAGAASPAPTATASTDPSGGERRAAGPAALAEWDARLRDLLGEDLRAGRRIRFPMKLLGRSAELVRFDTSGGLQARSDGSEFLLAWKDLSLEDRRNLAVARVRDTKPDPDLELAAFYHLACGAQIEGEGLLRKLPASDAERVRAAFKGAAK
jgi:hypothetical protein